MQGANIYVFVFNKSLWASHGLNKALGSAYQALYLNKDSEHLANFFYNAIFHGIDIHLINFLLLCGLPRLLSAVVSDHIHLLH